MRKKNPRSVPRKQAKESIIREIGVEEDAPGGLYEKERKHSRGFILTASFLFFLGVLFGYYVVSQLYPNYYNAKL